MIKNGLLSSFPPPFHDQHREIAIIDGDITGALVAGELGRHNHDVVVAERRELLADYGFEALGAILSELAASVDPYRMVYQLFDKVVARATEV